MCRKRGYPLTKRRSEDAPHTGNEDHRSLKNCARGGGSSFVRARYLKQMQAWGYSATATGQAWLDVCDVAALEMAAQ